MPIETAIEKIKNFKNSTFLIIEALDNCKIKDYSFDTSFGIVKPNSKIADVSNIFPRID